MVPTCDHSPPGSGGANPSSPTNMLPSVAAITVTTNMALATGGRFFRPFAGEPETVDNPTDARKRFTTGESPDMTVSLPTRLDIHAGRPAHWANTRHRFPVTCGR